MAKTILITGATDGIGLATAKSLRTDGHTLFIHGRNPAKLSATVEALNALPGLGGIVGLNADLTRLDEVEELAQKVIQETDKLDVLINNAGILRTTAERTHEGLDVRFMVNTIAPFLLTRRLLPLLQTGSRVVNLSSAAQAPVSLQALAGDRNLEAMEAYAQSKLAITMCTNHLAREHPSTPPEYYSVNPGSLLATKMVKEGFGFDGHNINKGVDILKRAATSDEFTGQSGQYFDNDAGQFSRPYPDALDPTKCSQLVEAIESILTSLQG